MAEAAASKKDLNRNDAILDWVNSRLKARELTIDTLSDLRDGVKLLHLLEILSGDLVGKFYQQPKTEVFMVENCSIALNFCKQKGINKIRVGAQEIVDNKKNAISSVLWNVMQFYHNTAADYDLKRLEAEEPVTPRGSQPDHKTDAHPPHAEAVQTEAEKRNSTEVPTVPKLQLDTPEGAKTEERRPRRSSSKTALGAEGSKSPRDKQKREKRHKDKSSKTPRDRRPSESEESGKSVPNVDLNTATKSGNNSLEPPKTENGATSPEMTPRTAEEYSLLTQIYSAVAPGKTSMSGNKRATIAVTSPEKQNSKSNLKAEQSAEAPVGQSEKTLGDSGPQSILPSPRGPKPAVPPRPQTLHRENSVPVRPPRPENPKAQPEPPPKIIKRVGSQPELNSPSSQSAADLDSASIPQTARLAREPSKVKIPKIFQQAESLVDENAKLRKEVERLRIQNEQMLRELELREPNSARDRSDSESNSSTNQLPSSTSSDKLNVEQRHHGDRSSVSFRSVVNVFNPFAGLKKKKELAPNEQLEEIARLNELVKAKDKEIARLNKELEGFKKEHNKNSRRSLSGNAPVLTELKEEKGKNKLSLRKIFTGGRDKKRGDGPSTLSEEFILEEEDYTNALTIIQAFIRRRNAMDKKSTLSNSRPKREEMYDLSAVVTIQAAIRRHRAMAFLKKLTHYKRKHRRVTKVQSQIKMHMARNNFRKLQRRKYIAAEITNTEKTYVDGLRSVVDVYLIPFKTNGVITPDQSKTIFSEIQVIMAYNQMLLKQFEDRVAKWTADGCLGDIFVKTTEFLKVYTTYCNNYNKAMELIYELKKSNPAFLDFVTNARRDPRCKDLEFMDLVVLPIQRIPRYVLLLEDMARSTPLRHPDYQPLITALEKMKTVAQYVNERKRDSENLQNVLKIQNILTNYNLAKPARRYLEEGNVTTITGTKRKNVYAFLFNDLLLFTKRNKTKVIGIALDALANKLTGKEEEKTYKMLIEVPITGDTRLQIQDAPNQKKPEKIISLTYDAVSVQFTMEEADRQKWITSLNAAIDEQHKRKESMKVDGKPDMLGPSTIEKRRNTVDLSTSTSSNK